MNARSSPCAPLVLDGQPLTVESVERVARGRAQVELDRKTAARIDASRTVVQRQSDGHNPIYGLNTGFGSLSRVRIAPDQVREVQRNLIRSHAAGVGEPLPAEVVRAMMVILAASLARARSGVKHQTVAQIVGMLNNDVIPWIPSRGSVGASGDLAPLAHLALVLIGEGEASAGSADPGTSAIRPIPGFEALKRCGLEPLRLDAKEGLALINGTHMMAAIGTLALADIERIQTAAVAAAGLAIDACRATDAFLDARLHALRRQPGQIKIAEALRELLRGSTIITAHRTGDPRVQDPYCLRACPQVLGAAFDAIAFARSLVEYELGAVTDNPLVFPDSDEPDSIVSGGNFHGMPLAIAFDTLKIALTHVAGIAERRVNWLLAASDSENPVNVYLSPQPGLHSGLMITQYTAAACCNELQTLAHPASVGNIPTSAGIEDYNSMGATAALQLRRAVERCEEVIAIELLVMTEAIEYQRPLRSGAGVERVVETVRSAVPRLTEDRPPAPDINAVAGLIRGGAFIPASGS
ncbi:MAG: histidine ammonia-lyase [Spirochaetaceae bacterium]|nr:MAG: histidine ammonia-lyase [Spirochaetaceae bacterium]